MICRRKTWFGRAITLDRAATIANRKSIWMKMYLEARTEKYRPGGRTDRLLGFYRTCHLAQTRERKRRKS